MTYKLHHFHLVCSDLDQMIHFFTKTLQGKFIAFRKFGTSNGACIDLGGAPIYLRCAREGEEITGDSPRPTYGYNHLGLAVEDLDAAYAELTAQGFVFTTLPTVTPTGVKMAFFQGPDKIVIELVQEKC